MTAVRALLVMASVVAALKVLQGCGQGMVAAGSVGRAIVGLLGVPVLLWLAVDRLRRSAQAQRIAVGVAVVSGLGCLGGGAVALLLLVRARGQGVAMHDALEQSSWWSSASALSLCAMAVAWGLVCAARIAGAPNEG